MKTFYKKNFLDFELILVTQQLLSRSFIKRDLGELQSEIFSRPTRRVANSADFFDSHCVRCKSIRIGQSIRNRLLSSAINRMQSNAHIPPYRLVRLYASQSEFELLLDRQQITALRRDLICQKKSLLKSVTQILGPPYQHHVQALSDRIQAKCLLNRLHLIKIKVNWNFIPPCSFARSTMV